MLDLEPIKRRLAEATPGPWEAIGIGSEGFDVVAGVGWNYPEKREKLGWSGHITDVRNGKSWDGIRANAYLIASAPTDIAALVAEVERLRAICESTSAIAHGSSMYDDDTWAEIGEVSDKAFAP